MGIVRRGSSGCGVDLQWSIDLATAGVRREAVSMLHTMGKMNLQVQG